MMNSEKTIVLCFDIDETVMNSQTLPITLIDFNGSNEYGDASAWINFLKKMTLYCQERSISLIVQMISAKMDALPDDTVEMISTYFHEYLHVLNKNGERVAKPYHPSRYILRRYLEENSQEDRVYLMNRSDGDERVYEENELPPIHLCFKNKPGSEITSKSWVMKPISEHFNEPIPAKNMFMLDNDLSNLDDISFGSGGTTPCYQAVSAHDLEWLAKAPKNVRTIACRLILEKLEARIIARVSEILEAPIMSPAHVNESIVEIVEIVEMPTPISPGLRLDLAHTVVQAETQKEELVIQSKFLTSEKINEILSHVKADSLLILDIDDTVGRVSQTIGLEAWFRFRIEQYAQEKHSSSQALSKAIELYNLAQLASRQMLPVDSENNIAPLIRELKKKGAKIIGLTARNDKLADKTIMLLETLGVAFSDDVLNKGTLIINGKEVIIKNGVIFASGNHKGLCLEHAREQGHFAIDIHSFKDVSFVDDSEKNCRNVAESLTKIKIANSCVWHYQYAEINLKFGQKHKERAAVQEAHLLKHQILLTDEEADILRVISILENHGSIGMSIINSLNRLKEGQQNYWNPYWMNSGVKLKRIVNAVEAIKDTDDLKHIINDKNSDLYVALNMQRLLPVTFFGRLGFNQAKSLIAVQDEISIASKC